MFRIADTTGCFTHWFFFFFQDAELTVLSLLFSQEQDPQGRRGEEKATILPTCYVRLFYPKNL
jgi:hypothetical protein